MPTSLKFTLEGADKSGGAVFFADFRTFLDDVAQCLRMVELRAGTGDRIRHEVSNLAIGSATLELTAVSPVRAPGSGKLVYDTFKKTVKALQRGDDIDPRFRPEDLKAFRELASPVLRDKRVEIAGVQITTQYVANIDKLLGSSVQSKGTVKGRLERVNVHNRHEFTLFAPIGETVIQCVFQEHLFLKVKQAIRQNVTVIGLLTFRGDKPYPDRVQVEDIEIHLPDDEIPTLRSLRGIMPNATNGRPVVEYVRGLRDE